MVTLEGVDGHYVGEELLVVVPTQPAFSPSLFLGDVLVLLLLPYSAVSYQLL